MKNPSPNVLTAARLREAVEVLRGAYMAPHNGHISYAVHPIDTRAHVYMVGWRWAAKQFYKTWNNRTDYERMDGLAWLVRGLFES